MKRHRRNDEGNAGPSKPGVLIDLTTDGWETIDNSLFSSGSNENMLGTPAPSSRSPPVQPPSPTLSRISSLLSPFAAMQFPAPFTGMEPAPSAPSWQTHTAPWQSSTPTPHTFHSAPAGPNLYNVPAPPVLPERAYATPAPGGPTEEPWVWVYVDHQARGGSPRVWRVEAGLCVAALGARIGLPAGQTLAIANPTRALRKLLPIRAYIPHGARSLHVRVHDVDVLIAMYECA